MPLPVEKTLPGTMKISGTSIRSSGGSTREDLSIYTNAVIMRVPETLQGFAG